MEDRVKKIVEACLQAKSKKSGRNFLQRSKNGFY